MKTSGQPPPAHLYVHVPFCARRCTYCDFSIAVRREPPVAVYLAALARELERAAAPAALDTVYLGGGTPSALGGPGLAALAALLRLHGRAGEFTIEANPEDVTPESARAWVSAGVNRLSLGAQSFDDAVLAWMHRTHRAARIGEAVRAARSAGVGNLSLDLIFALPAALARDWRRDLDAAAALEPDHISLYGLTVEPGTPLFRQAERGQLVAAGEGRYADEYLEAHERLAGSGYRFYEVSNAARPGREAVHNRAYWTLAPYLGVGPSAHSFDGVSRWWNEPAYARWRRLLAEGQSPVVGREILNDHQRRLEERYLGLRTTEGITLPEPCPAPLGAMVDRWVASGWAECEPGAAPGGPREAQGALRSGGTRLRLTPQGWLRLDELAATI
jgi:oxygen-independent coproporphyrinogen-3 oxidase